MNRLSISVNEILAYLELHYKMDIDLVILG